MTGVAITILVKKPKASDEAARIYYHDIGDYLSREEKLRIIRNMGDISNPLMQWVTITPNEHGDWLNKRSEQFKLYTPLGDKIDKKNKRHSLCPTIPMASKPNATRGVITVRYPLSRNPQRNRLILQRTTGETGKEGNLRR